MRNAPLLAHIRQLSCLGLPGQTLVPALLKSVREYVGAESAGFFWVDTRGEMTDLYAERVLPAPLMKLYFERHYDGPEMSFREAFRKRARASDQVISSSADGELQRTAYYNEILRHLDAHHMLYAIIRDQGSPLGQLSLYRPKSSSAFGHGERTALNEVCRFVAHAVARQPATADDSPGGGFLDSEDEGLVLADQKGRIVQGATHAMLLLSRAGGMPLSAQAGVLVAGQSLPTFAQALIADLLRLLANQAAPPPANIRDTPWGRYAVRAYLLGDQPGDPDALVGIQVKRLEPVILRMAEAMHHLELSPQQREVAILLAKGCSNPEIAEALKVSRNTAIYHIKQLFTRLDAHDRGEALQRILTANQTG
ncbi:MAG: helix-turn-helix transcriptional regulator [Betaproteobacteria bacterium]|nr:helix-turn-helix transcriptional regulator [Betaproteobacteria bacterium]